MPRVTIADVAREAGVSKGLASLALNGKPGVAAATRSRIAEVADRLGWRPNFAARALANSATGAYGLAIARSAETLSNEYFFMALVSGIEKGLSDRGLALVMQVVREPREEEALLESWSAERRVDGVILMDLRRDDHRVEITQRLELPAVGFGVRALGASVPTLIADENVRMGIVVRHLTGLGHRSILYVTGDASFEHVAVRSHCLVRHATEAGADIEVRTTDYGDPDVEEVFDELAFLPDDLRPTAIVADNDLLAIRLLSCAASRGIAVPRDLSLVALEDSLMCTLVTPAVTCLRRDVHACGEALVSMLAERIAGRGADVQAPSGELMVRASTAPPPALPE